jgi:serine phosphatase RsbU (regulator of sigma subunit)
MAAQNPRQMAPSLEDENQRLKRAVEELSILNDLARAIGASVNSEEIMRTIIHRSLRAIGAEQGVITLVDRDADDSMKTLLRTSVSSGEREQYHFNQNLLGWMHINKRPLMINDPKHDARFSGVKWDASVRSLVCVPLMIKSQLRGVLTVYNKKERGEFTEEDQRLLAIIAGQSAQVVENARLYEAEQALLKVREELRLASTIQTDLLPKGAPPVPGYDIAGKSVPAQLVGGDYFDFIALNDPRYAICLGDVSGKGLPASLLMANLQATLRGQTMLDISPSICVQRSNRLLFQSTSSDKFVTLFVGILDPVAHALTYTNAGHESPFLLRANGELSRLTTGGVVLSILEDFAYQEETVPLAPGDLLVIYSDGVTEAINPDERAFGEELLRTVLTDSRHEPSTVIIERIIASVNSHAGSAPQMDDMTIVVIKRTAHG